MKRYFFLSIFCLFSALPVCGEGYGFVFDTDLYVFVRQEPRAGAPVIDTVYNLQLLATGNERNGWVEAVGGWVHTSRLRPMPVEIARQLKDFDCHRGSFIAGPDTPHILLSFDAGRVIHPARDLYAFGQGGKSLTLIVEDCAAAYDMRTRLKVWEWDFPTYCQRAEITLGRIIVYDEFGVLSFNRDTTGKTCRTIIPLYTYYSYPAEEIETALETARQLHERCEGLDILPAREIFRQVAGTNNFDILYKLRSAYLSGDRRGLEYYPFVLYIADCDGGECHGLDYLNVELASIENSNTAVID